MQSVTSSVKSWKPVAKTPSIKKLEAIPFAEMHQIFIERKTMEPFNELLELLKAQPVSTFGHEIAIPFGKFNDVVLTVKLRHNDRTLHMVDSEIEIVNQGMGTGLLPEYASWWLILAKAFLSTK
jgi:hypothetical protein